MPDPRELDAHEAEQAARAALREDAATATLADASFRAVPGGLSNFAWQVSGGGLECFVRYARRHGERLGADHDNECRVLALTSAAGLSPPVVRCDPEARLLVTRWLAPRYLGRPLRSAPAVADVAQALALLHGLPAPQDLRHVRFDEQARALEQAFEPDAEADALRARALEVFAVLRETAPPPVLCHHDLNPLNLLHDREGRLWLVDWEYAGLGDAAIDLASYASQHGLEARQRGQLLQAYGRAGRPLPEGRFDLARWAFDYVQWAWYRAALAPRDAAVDQRVARGRAARLGASLRRRARSVLRCNNARFVNQCSTGTGQWRRLW
jgi:thiamine kinase